MGSSLKKCAVVFLLFFVFPVVATAAQTGKAEQVVFYPTDVTEAGEFAYLRDSVRLMLASRLASVAGGEMRLEKEMNKGRDFAFYRVMSRIVSTEDGVELSVKAFRPSEKSSLQFQSVAANSAEIIQALDILVADVGRSLFQVKVSSEKSKKPGTKADEEVDVSTSHPDRAYKANSGFGLSVSQDEYVSQMGLEVRASERYKSAVLSFQSQGMTAGDIDGDSLDEILVATNAKLYIYQIKDRKINHLDTISLPGRLKVHALNVADIDNNGSMEIYISCTRDNEPRSSVYEWHPSTGFKLLHENVYWYLRPLVIPGKGVVLAGQKSGVGSMLQPGISLLNILPGEKISAKESLALPKSVNLFDFVFADLDADKLPEVVTINRKEELQVYSSDLQLLYTSPAGFGGRELSEGYNAPIRLVVSDFDNDGHHDILLVDNELYSPKILSKTRLYRNGQVRGLLWDGSGFFEMWHTNIYPNSVVDFQFLSSVETTETGTLVKGRLFVVEPEKGDLLEGFLLGLGGSRLSVYGLDFTSKESGIAE